MATYNIGFGFKYPKVSPAIGCRHIHTPEHIATTHRLGAPGFVIERVKPPQVHHTSGLRSIQFECRTLNMPMHVFMYSRHKYESILTFTRSIDNNNKNSDSHINHIFPSLLKPPLHHMKIKTTKKNRAFLRLHFEVFPQAQGHELRVIFGFWNPLIFLLVPLFPVFVAINGIEDMFYLSKLQNETLYPFRERTWFDVYRDRDHDCDELLY